MNPLLDVLSLPRFTEITPDVIAPALDFGIAEHEAAVRRLVERQPGDFASTWLPFERANTTLDAIWSTVSHLNCVRDTPAFRESYAVGKKRLVENTLKVNQNEALYQVMVTLAASPDFAALPTADRVAVERAIRTFALSGVALEANARARFRAISLELSDLSTQFGNAVLDATDAWSELIVDEAELAGVPDADKAMFASAAAKAKAETGWLLTLQQPSVNAILTFAENRDLRARIYRASATRASDQGPHAGRFDNSERIARLLALRQEAAAVLGFPDAVALSLATKMAPNADQVLAFLRDLARRARPAAQRDLAELEAFAVEQLGITDLQPWDVGFVSNRLRQECHAIDEQQVRAHFPIERVLEGWMALLKQLFGIRLIRREDALLYHVDAMYFDVVDETGVGIAGLYLDLFARAGKRGGAWMDQARPRLNDSNTIALPVAYLVCNFAPNDGETPSLLSHSDVITLLHETGHSLHLLFTRVDRPSIAGTKGFEWDAIEFPSQLMEDFAWDREVLTAMSGHYRTGARLPADLFERMRKTRHFQTAIALVRQVELAMFDLVLHLGTLGSDPIEVLDIVRDEVAVMRPPEWNRFPHGFSHIFAGGYAAGYYSYLWAEQLAADGFMAFSENGLLDRPTGDRFREEVLARGATRSAAESFGAFRGREPSSTPMLVRHGLQ